MILPKNHVFCDAPRHEEVETSQHLVPIHVLYVGVSLRQQLGLQTKREREMTSERYIVKEKYCLREILHQRNIIQEKYRLREISSEMYPPTEILSTAIQSMPLTKCPDNSPGLCFCPASVWRFCGAAYHTGSSVPPERTPLPAPRSR